MGKPIKITPMHIAEVRREFEETLRNLKLSDGKISFTKTFGSNNEKTTVYFTSVAWTKMVALIMEFNDDVAWHGLARRGTDPEGYVIYDILVYPQEVIGATVNTDQEKYQVWLMEHEDDVFNNIRMQGHSHVNMATSPSSVDTTHQEKILDQLEDHMFYIFMIWNKKFESNTKVYDLQKNMLYENHDVSVKILDSGIGLDAFIADAKTMVAKKTYTSCVSTGYSTSKYHTPYNPPVTIDKPRTTVSGASHQPNLYTDYYGFEYN